MSDDARDQYKQWILSADSKSLLRQLNAEIKTPLISAQNLVNILQMMQNPSPSMVKKMESGELNPDSMLAEIAGFIGSVFDIIDFFRESLEE